MSCPQLCSCFSHNYLELLGPCHYLLHPHSDRGNRALGTSQRCHCLSFVHLNCRIGGGSIVIRSDYCLHNEGYSVKIMRVRIDYTVDQLMLLYVDSLTVCMVALSLSCTLFCFVRFSIVEVSKLCLLFLFGTTFIQLNV